MEHPNKIPEEIIDLFHTNPLVKKIPKGQFLFQEGTSSKEVFYLKQGTIQISKVIPDGRELTLRLSSPGDVIGEVTLFCKESTYMLSGKALEDVVVYTISKEEFESKLSQQPELVLGWLQWVQLQNQKNQTKFRDLLLHGKKGAVFSTLIRLTNSYGKKVDNGIFIDLTLTNQEIANFCGTSREVVNRLLNELKKEEVLSIDKGQLIIHNLQYLKDEINCENCPIEICRID